MMWPPWSGPAVVGARRANQLSKLSGVKVERVGLDEKQLDANGRAVSGPFAMRGGSRSPTANWDGPVGSTRASKTRPPRPPAGCSSSVSPLRFTPSRRRRPSRRRLGPGLGWVLGW